MHDRSGETAPGAAHKSEETPVGAVLPCTARGKEQNQVVLALRKSGGYCVLSEFNIIQVEGPDARAFLQARLSNDVSLIDADGKGQMSSLLDRRACVLAHFSLHHLTADRYWLLAEREQCAFLAGELEKFHFQEKVEIILLPNKQLWTVQGSKSALFLTLGMNGRPRVCNDPLDVAEAQVWNQPVTVINRSLTGESGYILVSEASEGFVGADVGAVPCIARAFEEQAQALNMVPLAKEVLEIARIEAGVPQYNTDFSNEHLLPETGLEQVAASYSKGCYPGQEVLARIRTYGAPRRALVGLLFESQPEKRFPLDTPIMLDGNEAGQIKSNCYSPTLQKHIALAIVPRDLRVPDSKLTVQIDGGTYGVTVVLPPFIDTSGKREQARRNFDAALAEFANGSEQKAIAMLRETIDLDPLFADAYESLGVVLSRHDQLDEAIALMKRLELLDPDSVMAHTNLSVFYMQQGNKEAAEDEKAKAMAIQMSKIAKEFAAKQQDEAERQRQREEAEQRMEMFRQVLEIDPDDFLANAGLGSILVEVDKYSEAIPFLQKALSTKQNHTQAYLALGQAYSNTGRTADAEAIFEQGIRVAAQRGDITPLKQMESLLANLKLGSQ